MERSQAQTAVEEGSVLLIDRRRLAFGALALSGSRSSSFAMYPPQFFTDVRDNRFGTQLQRQFRSTPPSQTSNSMSLIPFKGSSSMNIRAGERWVTCVSNDGTKTDDDLP